jgi:hypothetical protein
MNRLKQQLTAALILALLVMAPFLSLSSFSNIPVYATSTPRTTKADWVLSFDSSNNQWSTQGRSPYLDNHAQGNAYIYNAAGSSNVGKKEGLFNFAITPIQTITSVNLTVEAHWNSVPSGSNYIEVFNGSGASIGYLNPTSTSYANYTFTLTSPFNTQAGINNLEIYFEVVAHASPFNVIYIDRAFLSIAGTISSDATGIFGDMEYVNETVAVVNSTFPFSREGSSTLTNVTNEQLLDGVYLYLQTGNIIGLQGAEQVCQWLNKTQQATLQHLWETYYVNYHNSSAWGGANGIMNARPAAQILSGLAIYASLVPKWKPLLQEVVNTWLNFFLPSAANYRVYDEVSISNGSYVLEGYPLDYTFTSDSQSMGINAISIAANVLNNATLRNTAFSMIQEWVSISQAVYQDVMPIEYAGINGQEILALNYVKEDEGYANFMFALEAFYYLYPSNTTVKNWIKTYAWNGAEYMWDVGTGKGGYFNYKTGLDGSVNQIGSVHGFGMTDDALFAAYLIWGNTTWYNRAKQDFNTNVINGFIIDNGTIVHTQDSVQSEDGWAVYGRRFAVELYDYTNNATYLRAANNLFWNFTLKSDRTFGLQAQINVTSGKDWAGNLGQGVAGDLNDRDTVASYAMYRNVTTSDSTSSFKKLIQNFGLPLVGMVPPPITVTLTAPANHSASSTLKVKFQFKVGYFGTPPVNATLWTNSSGTWQKGNSTTSVSTAATNNITYTFSSYGIYKWNILVTDGTYWYPAAANYTLFVPSATVSPSSPIIFDNGQSGAFTSSIVGDDPPYTYQWYLNGTAVSGATGSTWVYNTVAYALGGHNIYLNVTDSWGNTIQSDTVNITVNPACSIGVSPTNATLDVGQSKTFTATVTGGTSPYIYHWYLDGSSVGSNSTAYIYSPTVPGSRTVYCNVTDSATTPVSVQSNPVLMTINTDPSVTVSPTNATIYLDESRNFVSSVSGGTSPYTYQWYLNNNPVPGATSFSWNFTPSSEGFYAIYVNVTDNVDYSTKSNTTWVTVNAAHDVAVINVTSSKTIVGQGFSANLTITVMNLGEYTETFKVTAYADATPIASQNITLTNGNSATIILTWNTTSFAYGNYTISAYAWPVPGEINIANNNFTDGMVKVTIPGDINGDGYVNLKDLGFIANHWLQTVPPAPANVDILNVGVINLRDLGIVTSHWQTHA